MERTYVYRHPCEDLFYLKTGEADSGDALIGCFEEERDLARTLRQLFERGYDLAPCDDYQEIKGKYCPPRLRLRELEAFEAGSPEYLAYEARLKEAAKTLWAAHGCKDFLVLPRAKAVRLSYDTSIDPCVIVSITDPEARPVHFHTNPQVKAVLRLSFADVEEDTVDAMTARDGERIVTFIRAWKDKVSSIVVQCEAGYSRSAGVCAALMRWLTGSDKAMFDDPRFKPNRRCYRLVLEQLQGEL